MTTPLLPTPQRADVLFLHSRELSSRVSEFVQGALDPWVSRAERRFSHVVIALDDSFAIEAVPEPSLKEREDHKGKWTGVDLDPGVRLVALADVFIPASREQSVLRVLRPPEGSVAPDSVFGIMGPTIAVVMGSEYSIKMLKESVEAMLAAALPRMLFDWRSTPMDVASKLGIDEDLRVKIARTMPTYVPQLEARTYFCSQLVAQLLQLAGLMDAGTIPDRITPTGLFARLRHAGWRDVTASDYSDAAIAAMAEHAELRANAAIGYLEANGALKYQVQHLMGADHVKVISASLEAMKGMTDRLMARLDRLRG
jgi:hypothetical protein